MNDDELEDVAWLRMIGDSGRRWRLEEVAAEFTESRATDAGLSLEESRHRIKDRYGEATRRLREL